MLFIPGPVKCRNMDRDFKKMHSHNNRHFDLKYIKRRLPNGKESERDWLIFSPSLDSVLCFVCKLFGKSEQSPDAFRTTGYKDWKNCNRAFEIHEKSKGHMKCYLSYRTRAKQVCTLDEQFLEQQETAVNYWRNLLRRIVSVVKFLASRGLAFRGSDQKIGSHSNGNYLGLLELLAEYDTFLAAHISKLGNKGTGECPCPLSSVNIFDSHVVVYFSTIGFEINYEFLSHYRQQILFIRKNLR